MSESKTVTVASVQTAFSEDSSDNVDRTLALTSEAADAGADIVVLPELFEGPYFCKRRDETFFDLARPAAGHPTIERFRELCVRRRLVVTVSFFERQGEAFYNSVAVIDGDGSMLGIYRKSHIPDGPGYQEKFYFRPGNSGLRVWRTCHGVIGVGICWDQWFPDAARAMALQGADLLLYPSAIGSEPEHPEMDTRPAWQRCMIGHAVANSVAVAAANRIGCEAGQSFYGHSFVVDHRGEIVDDAGDGDSGYALATFDWEEVRRYREWFGLLRDRRPDLYASLCAVDAPGGRGPPSSPR